MIPSTYSLIRATFSKRCTTKLRTSGTIGAVQIVASDAVDVDTSGGVYVLVDAARLQPTRSRPPSIKARKPRSVEVRETRRGAQADKLGGHHDQRRELRCGMSLSESDLGVIGRIVKPYVKRQDDELRAEIREDFKELRAENRGAPRRTGGAARGEQIGRSLRRRVA